VKKLKIGSVRLLTKNCARTVEVDRFANAVRGHWSIENSCHWALDVVFGEDLSRLRVGNAAENLAVLRRLALNLLKTEKTAKVGVRAKRFQATFY
jgi:predicted transposase YbfD/YdcC